MFGKVASFVAAAAICVVASTSARAGIVFNGSSGQLSASVTFTMADGNLQVTLANTSASDVMAPTEVLTAVFFDTGLSLLKGTATASSVEFGPPGESGGDVSGEWAYKSGMGATGDRAGLSSSGFGVFGPADRFSQENLQGPASPDGLQYGITSTADNLATGNQAVTGGNALIRSTPILNSSVVFTFTGVSGIDLNSFRNIRFQYGTDLSEPGFAGSFDPISSDAIIPVPEAPTLIAGALLLLPFGASALRIVRRKPKA